MHEFWIKRQILGTSTSLKSNNQSMVTIILQGAHNNQSYRTYIVRSHDNWDLWQDVLKHGDKEILIGFETVKYIGKDKDIIDADCVPHIIQTHSKRSRTAKQQAVLDQFDSLKVKIEDLFE